MNQPRVERYTTRALSVKCPFCEKGFILRFRVSDDATEDERARLSVVRPCPYCQEDIAYEVDARLDKKTGAPMVLSAQAHVPTSTEEDAP